MILAWVAVGARSKPQGLGDTGKTEYCSKV